MTDWIDALAGLRAAGARCVLVTVAQAEGSTPREAGAKMVVSAEATSGTIGGGHLEHKAIEIARGLIHLAPGAAAVPELRRFPLGPSLGQCCGGSATLVFEPLLSSDAWLDPLARLQRAGEPSVLATAIPAAGASPHLGPTKLVVWADGTHGSLGGGALEAEAVACAREWLAAADRRAAVVPARSDDTLLLLERIAPSDFHVAVFGAGHVGKALVSVLAGLPCRITWIDSRVDQFPSSVPSNATVERTDAPEYTVRQLPPDSYVLIMTHSHPLDLQICEGALRRDDFTYVGLIGSKTKRTKFERRLLERGLEVTALARLTCPIGVPGVTSKHPAVIAVAVAAQLLQAWSATQSRRASASPASVAQSFGFACLSRAELRLRLRLSPSSAG